MRPLSLTVSGLHSYREPVTIDFSDLGRFGLFGIFGRIGSGKSTILDAMTLALYGLVDRVATRSRRGLVHLGAERCEVRLTFAVDGPQGAETWEVHRAYRDEGGIAVRTASRLVRRDGGRSLVVAEKERDVNLAVAEVVGLGPEDFTRAVVLPQGRFVQLLHLKGQERRQMLSRMFRLQAYGEVLRRQVRDRQAAVTTALAAARGELAGLGDASAGAVRRASAAADAAEREATAADEVWGEIRDRHARARHQREHHERWRMATDQLTTHEAGAAAQAERMRRLAEAERIGPWVGPARRLGEALDRRKRAEGLVAGARQRAEAAEAEATVATQARDVVRARSETEEPALRDRLARLVEVARWEHERADLLARQAEAAATVTSLETAAEAARGREAEARTRATAFAQERRSRKTALARTRVPADERERMVRAARAADALGAARRWLAEARAAETETRAKADAAAAVLAEAESAVTEARAAVNVADAARKGLSRRPSPAQIARLEEALARADQDARSRDERAADAEAAQLRLDEARRTLTAATALLGEAATERRAATEVLRGAARAVQQAETELEAMRRSASAALLSASLGPDVPCPVCGSTHHPGPADPVVHPDGDRFEAVLDAHRLGHERAVARHEDAVAAHATAEAAQAAGAALLGQATAAAERVRVSMAGVPKADPAAVATRLERARTLLARHEESARAQHEAALALERALVPHASAAARHDAALAAAVQAEAARGQRAADEGDAWAAFDAARGDLTLFDLPWALVGLDARDREAEALATAIEEAEEGHAAAVAEVDAARSEASGASSEAAVWVDRAREARERAERLGVRIHAELGDAASADAVATATTQLRALRAEREVADTTQVAAERASTAAARDLAAAEAEVASASDEVTATERQLAPVFGAGVDPEAAAALAAAHPGDAVVAAWRVEIVAWAEQRAVLTARLAALREGALEDDVVLDDAAFASLTAELATARADADRTRGEASAARNQAEELTARAARHDALTAESTTLDRDQARLDELNTLLRGDRFVEYVANDHLADLVARATTHLSVLTSGRYRLDVDEEASFVVHDEDAGGAVRPVHTLSGGEAFLTALSLALALSTQVQARSSRPLGFFFLDEGFGTLDPEALDRVMTAIEQLRDGHRLIGLISHVPAVRERVPRYLWVEPPRGERGSSVELKDN